MEFLARQVESQASIYNDLHSLDRIRQQGQSDQRSAIKAAAKEFEAFFMNMMLKSMRQASEVIGEDSMLGSQQEKMFVGMLDEQMSVDLSQKGNLGIAELLTRDLLGDKIPINSGFDLKDHLPKAAVSDVTNRPQNNHQSVQSKFVDIISANSANSSVVAEPNMQQVNKNNYLDKLIESDNDELGSDVNRLNMSTSELKSSESTNPVNTTAAAIGSMPAKKKSLFSDAESFIQELLPAAKKISESLGVDPRLLLAQAALETGWGQYIMHDQSGKPSYNLFGIKGGNDWQGESVTANTLEVEQGTFVKRQDDFRMYESFEQSFQDYVNFVKSSPRYQQAVKAVDNAKDYIRNLQESGYATDPNYTEKIINIYENGIKQSPVLK